MSPDERHPAKVMDVQEQVRGFFERKQKVRIYHGSTNSTRSVRIDKRAVVDTSSLNEILEINPEQRYAVVESNVKLDQLVEATLKFGLVPAVVSEFPGISIGGAVQGGAGESSSFKWGGFHEICTEYEVVCANGDMVTASAEVHAELFRGLPCSCGTIGILTRVKLTLIPATRNVQLEYIRVSSYDEALQLIRISAETTADFVDAIMFAPDRGVVMVGTFTTEAGLSTKTFHKPSDEWFYIHAEEITARHESYKEAIPVKDYLFRYDRGAFWMGRYGYTLYRFPFNRFTRLWFASLMKTRTMYKYLHGANLSQKFIIQDVCLPHAKVTKFLEYLDEHCGIYPLWLCPLKTDNKSNLAPNNIETDLVVNVGVWGAFRGDYEDFVAANRNMEHFIAKLGGRKVLYAHTYYTRDEFWRNYSRAEYDKLRNNYEAAAVFPEIYEKVVVRYRLAPSMLKGWIGFIRSPFEAKDF